MSEIPASTPEAPVSVSPEQDSKMSVTQLREKLTSENGLTGPQVNDRILELNRLADEQLTDPADYTRSLRDNYGVGLSVALKAGDEKVVEVMRLGYARIESELIGLKIQTQDSASEAPSPKIEQPFGFSSSQPNTEAAPTEQ